MVGGAPDESCDERRRRHPPSGRKGSSVISWRQGDQGPFEGLCTVAVWDASRLQDLFLVSEGPLGSPVAPCPGGRRGQDLLDETLPIDASLGPSPDCMRAQAACRLDAVRLFPEAFDTLLADEDATADHRR